MNKKFFTTKNMIIIGMLSAVAFVLMLLEFPIPIFPEFLKMDLSDIPAVIGLFALGTPAGIAIELIKNLLKALLASHSAGVGEVANFIVGISYLIPLGMLYSRLKNKKSVFIGSILGTISMILFASILNYYILIPTFAQIFGAPIDSFVKMTNKFIPLVKDFKTMIIFSIAPFNLLKAIIVSLLSYKLYTVLSKTLNKIEVNNGKNIITK